MKSESSENLFLGLEGLRNIVKGMDGGEHIHVGIRPYGFHGGNALALACYPSMLCDLYVKEYSRCLRKGSEKRGQVPFFKKTDTMEA